MLVTRRLILLLGFALLSACSQLPERSSVPKSNAPPSAARSRSTYWDELAASVAPAREDIRDKYRYRRNRQYTSVKAFHYFFYSPDGHRLPVGFSLVNKGSEHVNPRGLKKTGPTRRYSFFYPDRAKENIHLEINDDVHLTGRISHDNMFRELHFFPRRQLPAVELIDAGKELKVTLPTGEPVVFDAGDKEILGGVLSEKPIDYNGNRNARANPRVSYQGKYLMITVAQRGEAPRRAKVWGQTKFANVYYPAKYSKSCRLSPKYIWDQHAKPGDSDPTLVMLHHSDESLFSVVEKQCGWNLDELRAPNQRLAKVQAR